MVYFFRAIVVVAVVFNASDLSVLFRYFMNEPDIGNEYGCYTHSAVAKVVVFFTHLFVRSLFAQHQQVMVYAEMCMCVCRTEYFYRLIKIYVTITLVLRIFTFI